MDTYWTGSPTTSTPVVDIPIGAVVKHTANGHGRTLWRVTGIVEGKTSTALHVVRYRGRRRNVICVVPGERVAVVDGATR